MPKIFKYGNVFIGKVFHFWFLFFGWDLKEWIHDAMSACSRARFALSSTPSLSTIAENSTENSTQNI
jgi:hypothetical protein